MSTRGSMSSSASAGNSSATQAGLFSGNQSVARIVVRNALSTSASRRPLPPSPTMPIRARCRSRVGRRMNSRFFCASQNVGRLRKQRGEQGDRVVGHLVGEHARSARDRDIRRDHRRHEAVVHPGGRRLNPPQPPLPHHLVPGHRHLGVAAKNVGRQQLRGHPFLAGIDDFGRRARRPRFERGAALPPGNRARFAAASIERWRGWAVWHSIKLSPETSFLARSRGCVRCQIVADNSVALPSWPWCCCGWRSAGTSSAKGSRKSNATPLTGKYRITFSAAGFLSQAKGPFAEFFHSLAPNGHDWQTLARRAATEPAAHGRGSQGRRDDTSTVPELVRPDRRRLASDRSTRPSRCPA